jgi:hypothetical protein
MTTQARDAASSRNALARLLETSDLPSAVRRLTPDVLHQLIRTAGLDECGQVIALATPEQLRRVFDLDLWANSRLGRPEQFDAARFGHWLEVLVDVGPDVAADKLAALGVDFVTAAITRHVTVVEHLGGRQAELTCEIGGCTIFAKRTESWDAVVDVLTELETKYPAFFRDVMVRCISVSNERVDDNGSLFAVLEPDEQIMADAAGERDERREKAGFVTPPQAIAFLELSMRVQMSVPAVPDRDYGTKAYFRDIDRHPSPAADRGAGAGSTFGVDSATVSGARRLLPSAAGDDQPRLASITELMQAVSDRDASVLATRNEELGYLANVLLAGCTYNCGPFNEADAYRAAVSVCNLGLENWPIHWLPHQGRLPTTFLIDQDLVTVFQIGWTVLHERVGLFVAQSLARTLSQLTVSDSEVHSDIADLCVWLRRYVKAGTPWRAQDRIEVIAILDTPSWAILCGLLDRCPVIPKPSATERRALRVLRVPSDVEFIAENRQIAWVEQFMRSLPDRLVA